MGSYNLFTSFLNVSLVYVILVTLYKTSTCYETYYVEDLCKTGDLNLHLSRNGSSSSGILRATRHTSYSLQMTCRIRIVAPPGGGILISIREIGFRSELDGSCKDYLKIPTDDDAEMGADILCHAARNFDETRTYTSHISNNNSDSKMTLFYHTANDLDNVTKSGYLGFTLIFTAFRYAKSGSCEDDQEFRCDNSRCIWSGLLCDGHNNCGDLSDEKAFGASKCGYVGNGSLILVITGALILVIGFVSAIITLVCYQERQRRRRSTMRLRRRTDSLFPIIESLQNRPMNETLDRTRGSSYQTFRSTELPTVRTPKSSSESIPQDYNTPS